MAGEGEVIGDEEEREPSLLGTLSCGEGATELLGRLWQERVTHHCLFAERVPLAEVWRGSLIMGACRRRAASAPGGLELLDAEGLGRAGGSKPPAA